MKQLLFFLFCIGTLPCFAQLNVIVNWQQTMPPANSDTIYYNTNKKLTWKDFKGTPEDNSNALAITYSGFGFFAGMQSKNGKTDIGITVYCYFSKNHSWVKKGKESAYALNHEQHHFDVTYIATCLFIEKLKKAKFTRNNYNAVLNKIYAESQQLLLQMQNDYDGETKNGQLKNMQAVWNDKIEKQVNAVTLK
jgi:hypothetical protein